MLCCLLVLTLKNTPLSGDCLIPVSRDEISTRPARTDFTLRLQGAIKFYHEKEGQFCTWY